MKKNIFIIIVICTFTSCVFPSYVEHPKNGQESVFLARADLKIEFIETKSVTGNNITIADILEIEKRKYGNDISIINIKEQRRITSFLYIFSSYETNYMYDIVRYKK
jgi:hypothetical protein